MGRASASVCLLLLGSAWAAACGADDDSPTHASAGDAAGGSVSDAGARSVDAGQSSGGLLALGGAATTMAGASAEAGANDVSTPTDGGAAGATSADHGQLLFGTPGAGAVAHADLFRVVTGLVWSYELAGKSFIATGPATGGQRVDLVESSAAISAFNVGSVIAYQAGVKLFVHPIAATKQTTFGACRTI